MQKALRISCFSTWAVLLPTCSADAHVSVSCVVAVEVGGPAGDQGGTLAA
jgi:hypothetical protein